MGRYLRNGATAVSLALCIAVAWQWSWAHARSDVVRHARLVEGGRAVRSFSLLSVKGGIQVSVRTRDVAGRPAGALREGWATFPRVPMSFFSLDELANETQGGFVVRLAGFQARGERDSAGRGQFQMRIATAWLLTGSSILPLMALHRMRHRPATTACAACGYDLRATPERCPECGRKP